MQPLNPAEASWDEVARVFDSAVERPKRERDAFLDRACGADARLREQVETLLRAHEGADDFFAGLEASVFGNRDDRPEPSDPYLGDRDARVGPYRLLGRVGAGGMGVVYKARDTRLDRLVALKVLPPGTEDDTDVRARFLREARSAAALQHPNACAVHDVGDTPNGGLYIAMDFYRGDTLDAWIADGPLPPATAREIILQASRALASAHASGLVHRDVKPSNLILTNTGERHALERDVIVKVIDFGLAKSSDAELTRDGGVRGTVAYMSPEQSKGALVDARTDVWSTGVVLYEMLTGVRPFQGDTQADLIEAIRTEMPVPVVDRAPDTPPALAEIVDRCLQKDPDRRYPDAGAMRTALEPSGGAQKASASTGTETAWWWGMGGVGLILVAGLVAVVVYAASPPDLPATRHVVVASGPVDQPADAAETAPDPRASAEPGAQPALERGQHAPVGLAAGLVRGVTTRLRLATHRDSSAWIVPAPDAAPTDDAAPDGVVTPRDARERHGATLLLRLTVQSDSPHVAVALDLIDTRTERTLRQDSLAWTAADVNGLPDAVTDSLAVLSASMLEVDPSALAPQPVPENGRVVQYYTEGLGRLRHNHVPGNVDAAIALFRRALDVDSTSARAYAGLGQGYWRRYTATRDPAWIDSAVAVSERALVLDSDLAEAHVTLGRIDSEQGRHGSALAHFRYVLRRDPTSTRAQRGLARALEGAGRLDEAEAAYRDVIDRSPAYWAAYNDLGKYFLRRGRHDAAARQFQEVIQLAPNNAIGHRNLGVAHYFDGDLDGAATAFQTALDLAPDYATLTNLGTIHMTRGRYADAAQAFADALDLHDADHRVWSSYAEALHWSGRRDSARQAFETAIQRANDQLAMNPQRSRTLASLADYHAVLGDSTTSRRYLRSAIEQRPESVDVVFRIGGTLALLGERSRALHWFQHAIKQGYRFQNRSRYPRLEFLWNDPRFRQLVEQSRSSSPPQ